MSVLHMCSFIEPIVSDRFKIRKFTLVLCFQFQSISHLLSFNSKFNYLGYFSL